jgi:Ca-activated chloride channel family protein
MRIAYPNLWWLAILPAIALALMLYARWRRGQVTRALGDRHLIDMLTTSVSLEKRLIKAVMILLALGALVFAALRPQFGRRSEVQQQSGIDIAVAFDISKSMLARDVYPSRLDAARNLLTQVVNQMNNHRLALIPFSGIAFTQSPLTADKSAFRLFLRGLNPQQMPIGGTNLAMAISEGTKRLSSNSDRGDKLSRSSVLLLITDGEDLAQETREEIKTAVKDANEAGVIIYAIAVGTVSGEPIPILNKDGTYAGYKRDRAGKPIHSKLNLELLRDIIEQNTPTADPSAKDQDEVAKYRKLKRVFLLDGHQDLVSDLATSFSKLKQHKLNSSIRHRYGEKYAYALIPALILLLLEMLISDRRKSSTRARSNEEVS